MIKRLENLGILHFFDVPSRVLEFISKKFFLIRACTHFLSSCLHEEKQEVVQLRDVEQKEVPNAPNVQPQGTTINDEFHEAIWMLCQDMINHVRQQRGDQQEEAET